MTPTTLTVARRFTAGILTFAIAAGASTFLTACDDFARPVTLVVTASAAEPAPTVEPIVQMLQDRALAASEPAGGAVDVVVAGKADIETVDLTPMRKQEVEAVPERAENLVDTHLGELAATLSAVVPGADELDLLTAYDRGLRHTTQGGTVVVLSSGAQTIDPIDLNALGWAFDPKAVARDLASRDLVPNAEGRHVVMYGIGITLGTQPALPQPQRERLQQLWYEICVAGHAASCEIADIDTSMTMPISTRPVTVIDIPDLDTSDTSESPCRAATLTIPEAVLFEVDTSIMRPGADTALAGIAAQLSQCPLGVQIRVVGHTADVYPNRVDGQDLSERRAQACRNELVALGVPADLFVEVRGVADTEPRVPNIVDGQFRGELAQYNRRVDIVVETH